MIFWQMYCGLWTVVKSERVVRVVWHEQVVHHIFQVLLQSVLVMPPPEPIFDFESVPIYKSFVCRYHGKTN